MKVTKRVRQVQQVNENRLKRFGKNILSKGKKIGSKLVGLFGGQKNKENASRVDNHGSKDVKLVSSQSKTKEPGPSNLIELLIYFGENMPSEARISVQGDKSLSFQYNGYHFSDITGTEIDDNGLTIHDAKGDQTFTKGENNQ